MAALPLASPWSQLKISLGRFSTVALPLPPSAEQQRIVEDMDRRLSVIEELEAMLTANLKRAERLRQSILHRAFSGQLEKGSYGYIRIDQNSLEQALGADS